MPELPRSPPTGRYRGWVVVFGCLIVEMVTRGLMTHSFGLFVVPATHDLRLSRTDANKALILLLPLQPRSPVTKPGQPEEMLA